MWEQAHQHVREYDLDAFADMFAPDGVLELPFAPSSIPRRLSGREAIRGFLAPAGEAARSAGRRIKEYSSVVVHETTDPEIIIAEFDLDGEIVGTGETYQLSYIQVLRARNGQIVWMRDYMDPRVFSRIDDS